MPEYQDCTWMTFSESLQHYLGWRDVKSNNWAGWKNADEQMVLAAARMDQLVPTPENA